MKRMTVHGPGLLATVGGVVALLCVSLSGPTGGPAAPQTRHIHTVADRTDHHDDGGNDDGNDDGVNGLAKTLNDVALLAPPPIRPGSAR